MDDLTSLSRDVAAVAALIGDPARSRMLLALLGGRALPAGELADAAGVTPQTASAHLNKLRAGGLLALEAQGRHRYYRLTGGGAARLLEELTGFAAGGEPPNLTRPALEDEDPLRFARTCYDHLAGRVGVALSDALVASGALVPAGRDYRVTRAGAGTLAGLGVEVASLARRRRHLARRCLDWTERRPHVGGAVGAALAGVMVERRWVVRTPGSRALHVTPGGLRGLEGLGVRL